MFPQESHLLTPTFANEGDRQRVRWLLFAAPVFAVLALTTSVPLDPGSTVTRWLTAPTDNAGPPWIEPRVIAHCAASWLGWCDRPTPQVPDAARFVFDGTHFWYQDVRGRRSWSYPDIQDVVMESLDYEQGTTIRLLIVTARSWHNWTASPIPCDDDDAPWLREVIVAATARYNSAGDRQAAHRTM